MSTVKRLLACILVVSHLSGCASTMPVVSEAQRSRMGVVGVVAFSDAAKGELDVGPRGRAAGAAQGAAGGAFAGLRGLGGSSCSGPGCGAAVLLIPIFVAVGATVGAIIGAAQATPYETAQEMEAQLNAALSDFTKQERLRSKVIEAAARSGVTNVKEITVNADAAMDVGGVVDYRMAGPKVGMVSVLEVGLVRAGLIGRGGEDPELGLLVQAIARLVDIRTNEEFYRNVGFTHFTARRKFSEWIADDALLLKRELGHAYESLATSIVDEVFLVVRSN